MKEQTFSHFKPWKVRDKVQLKTRNLKLQVPSRKLSAKQTSPFEITYILCSLLIEATKTVEDSRCVPCLPPIIIQGDSGTWPQLPTAYTGTHQNREEI